MQDLSQVMPDLAQRREEYIDMGSWAVPQIKPKTSETPPAACLHLPENTSRNTMDC